MACFAWSFERPADRAASMRGDLGGEETRRLPYALIQRSFSLAAAIVSTARAIVPLTIAIVSGRGTSVSVTDAIVGGREASVSVTDAIIDGRKASVSVT